MVIHAETRCRKDRRTRTLLAGALMSALCLNAGAAGAQTADDLLDELHFVELWAEALDFDRERWANPPDHAVARSIASFPVCAATGISGLVAGDAGISFIPEGKGIIDPSLKLTAKAAAEVSFTASSKLAWDGSQGVSLRLCIDLFPWFQFGYYEARGESVPGDNWQDEHGMQGYKYAQEAQSDPFYAALSADAKAFLESGYRLMYGEAGGAAKKVGEIEMIRTLAGDAGDLLDLGADGVVTAIDAMGAILSTGSFLVDGIGSNPLTELQGLAQDMETALPIGQVVSSAVNTALNSTMEMLDPCQLVGTGGALQTVLPAAIMGPLDTECGGVRQFTDFGGDALQAGLDGGADVVAMAGSLEDVFAFADGFEVITGIEGEVEELDLQDTLGQLQSLVNLLDPVQGVLDSARGVVDYVVDKVNDAYNSL